MEQNNLVLINRAAAGDDLAIMQLFNTYLPIVKKLQSQFYIVDFEMDDWYQEAQIILFKSVNRFDPQKNVTFGSFYKRNLHNRIIDIIRGSQAKKRIPQGATHSIDANQSYYADTIADRRDTVPDEHVLMTEAIVETFDKFSDLEKEAFIRMLEQNDAKLKLAPGVINAFDRCRKKFYDNVD